MKKKVKGWLTAIEWLLLVSGMLMIAPMVNPFSDMYDFYSTVREAKKDNIYFEGPNETQTYFGRSLKVKGVIYDGSELTVLVRGCRFGPTGKLPMHGNLRMMDGREIRWSSSGSGSTIFCARGFYSFDNVPADYLR